MVLMAKQLQRLPKIDREPETLSLLLVTEREVLTKWCKAIRKDHSVTPGFQGVLQSQQDVLHLLHIPDTWCIQGCSAYVQTLS